MFPIKDDNPTDSFPIVTITFIVINVVVFIIQLSTSGSGADITAMLSVNPARFMSAAPVDTLTINPFFTLVTYAFLHAGIGHIAFNMLFLWIFGNNVEDALGKIRFVLFYILCGIAAALLHIVMNLDSSARMVGASGAIAGILGAYLILFPKAHIDTLFIIFFFIRRIKVPAVFFIGFWFFMQIMNVMGGAKGSTAWYAHIGGFIAGIVLIILFKPTKKKKRKLKVVYH